MASSNNATDLLLWQSLDKELLSMVETFGNLIKASTVLDEEVDPVTHGSSRERKAPGDLLEVWAEKLVYSGYTSLHVLSKLKKGALLSDFDSLVNNVRVVKAALKRDEEEVNDQLGGMKLEVQELLADLEKSYYSTQHRGSLITAGISNDLAELCQLAAECDNKLS